VLVRRVLSSLLVILGFWAQAHAQECRLPGQIPQPTPDQAEDARPDIRPDGFILALSWSPSYCQGRDGPRDRIQCSLNRFGLVVHGLWPVVNGKAAREQPRYCKPTALLPRELIAAHLCRMPDPNLMQKQWARHGTCFSAEPDAYFNEIARLWQRLRKPDIAALAEDGRISPAVLRRAMAAQNAAWGLREDALMLTADRKGQLGDIRICLDLKFEPRTCEGRGNEPKKPLILPAP